MEEIIREVVKTITEFATNTNPIIGIIIGISLIILESMLPVLPLALFIAINTIMLGNILGFIVSWLATVAGCMLSFFIFRKGISGIFYKNLKEDGHVLKFMRRITDISFANLVLITAMPFTPAFSVNIAAGLSKISYKKFLCAILIGKIPMVYFWGFIGTTFLESLGEPIILIKICIMLIVVYVLSKIVSKKFNIE